MADDRRADNATFIFNSIFTAMGMMLLGVATWIAVNVTDIPVMKNQLGNLANQLSGYVQQLNDFDKRLRRIEDRQPYHHTGGV